MDAINGKGFKVDRKEFQSIGINMADGLRLIRAGSFDVASIQVGLVASDDVDLGRRLAVLGQDHMIADASLGRRLDALLGAGGDGQAQKA